MGARRVATLKEWANSALSLVQRHRRGKARERRGAAGLRWWGGPGLRWWGSPGPHWWAAVGLRWLPLAGLVCVAVTLGCGVLATTAAGCSPSTDTSLETGNGPTGSSTAGGAKDALPAVFPGDKLCFGVTYKVNLDLDPNPETVLVSQFHGSLTITDGSFTYHSREKWHIAEAWIGDTDHDGVAEIVTLLDADDGRHLGLFAYFGGEYRERLVTQALSPEPYSLTVVPRPLKEGGDLLLLVEKVKRDLDGTGETYSLVATFYRWNGFGFTAVNQP
ncbi:MAG: hypothetical protein N3B14_09555 [Thermoleophilia bacterium]|nr:hypothetical protein [Thermoleophilia bacterium]